MSAPYSYNQINNYNAHYSPSTVHCQNTDLVNFYKRYLLEKVQAVFEWSLPPGWNRDYFERVLYCNGYVSIINTDKFGVIPQNCGLYGYDVFYQPTNVTIVNPLLSGILRPRIGTQCALIKMQPDYKGVVDIISYYADLLALCADAASINVQNSKIATVFTAADKAQAESYKKMYDQLAAGNPISVIDKSLRENGSTWETFNRDVRASYILSDLLADMRRIEQQFDTLIGLPNANTDKKERLITAEVQSNSQEVASLRTVWLNTMRDGVDVANRLFNISLAVKFRWEGDSDASFGRNNAQV